MAKLDKLTEQATHHLEPGESILAAVQGSYETKVMGKDSVRPGILIATDRRIVFFAKKLGGYELESFAYPNISSVEQGKNMMGHNVTFYASGNKAHMKWIKADSDLQRFSDTVKGLLNSARTAPPAQAAPATPAAAEPDVMDQLKRLGELRDAGVLTQEEFDAKKASLLARL